MSNVARRRLIRDQPIDWSLSNVAIARQLQVTGAAVARVRRQLEAKCLISCYWQHHKTRFKSKYDKSP